MMCIPGIHELPDEFLFVFIKAREKHISGLGQLFVSDSPECIIFLNLARYRCRLA